MQEAMFGFKRCHWVTLAKARELLGKRFWKEGLTPGRLDVLRMVVMHGEGVEQTVIRKVFGVTRASISRMLIALERLGWIRRTKHPWIPLQKMVFITKRGRKRVRKALAGPLADERDVRIVRDALREEDPDPAVPAEMVTMDWREVVEAVNPDALGPDEKAHLEEARAEKRERIRRIDGAARGRLLELEARLLAVRRGLGDPTRLPHPWVDLYAPKPAWDPWRDLEEQRTIENDTVRGFGLGLQKAIDHVIHAHGFVKLSL